MFLKPCFLYFVTFVFLTACSNEFDGKDGIKTVYFPNSKIVKQVVEYKDGKRIGELKEYFRNGTLSIKQRYKNDTLTDTSFFYHENGNLKYIQILKDFKKEGTWKKFNEQGKVYEEINFKDDELDGPSITYTYRTGRVLKKLNYKEGEMEGKQEYFYNNGKPKMTTVYHNGTQTIGTEEWTESGEKLNTDFKINVIERNRLLLENKLQYYISLENPQPDDEVYVMADKDSDNYPVRVYPLDRTKNDFILEYKVNLGGFVLENIKIGAYRKTSMGNTLLKTKTITVAANNY